MFGRTHTLKIAKGKGVDENLLRKSRALETFLVPNGAAPSRWQLAMRTPANGDDNDNNFDDDDDDKQWTERTSGRPTTGEALANWEQGTNERRSLIGNVDRWSFIGRRAVMMAYASKMFA